MYLLCSYHYNYNHFLQREEAMGLFQKWGESTTGISVADALLLLAGEFQDVEVRKFAVGVLERSDDEDLILYLLQLVQALRCVHSLNFVFLFCCFVSILIHILRSK